MDELEVSTQAHLPAFSEARLKSLGNLAHTSPVGGNPLHITTYTEIQCDTKLA